WSEGPRGGGGSLAAFGCRRPTPEGARRPRGRRDAFAGRVLLGPGHPRLAPGPPPALAPGRNASSRRSGPALHPAALDLPRTRRKHTKRDSEPLGILACPLLPLHPAAGRLAPTLRPGL